MFDLIRIDPDDGAGLKNGWILTLVKAGDDGKPITDRETQSPKVGYQVLVENLLRWYHTSEVTSIISVDTVDEKTTVIFRTKNSTYKLEKS